MRRPQFVMAIFLAAAAAIGALACGEGGRSVTDIEGAWSVTTGEKAGRPASPRDLPPMRMAFNRGEMTFSVGQHTETMKYQLNESATPKQITFTDPDDRIRTGIYQLSGDRLKMCIADGPERPKQFASDLDSRTSVMDLQRSTD